MENEVISQTTDEIVGDNLFDDGDDIETSNDDENLFEGLEDEFTEDDESFDDDETMPSESPKKEEPFLNIKFNKENIGLTKDEAIELAEKGKNYDRIKGKYDETNNLLQGLATRSGMSVDEFLKTLSDTQERLDVDREIDVLKAQYPTTDENVLRELATSRIRERNGVVAQQNAKAEQEKVEQRQNEIARQVANFQKQYPNLQADKLDPSVYEMMDNEGYTLLEAYTIFKATKPNNGVKQSQVKVNEQKERNKTKSYGSMTNSGKAEGDDDFFGGFNSAF